MAARRPRRTPTQAGAAAETQPQVFINAQYVKDFSFENPRAPHSLMQAQQAPEVQIGVDVKAQNLAPGLFEVLLTIHADAKSGTDRVFLVELVYGAVTTVQNVPEVGHGADPAGRNAAAPVPVRPRRRRQRDA